MADDKAAKKDRIEDRADSKKQQIDKNADREKAKVDAEESRAKDKVDGKAPPRDSNSKTNAADEVSDTWITTKVKASFVGEDSLKNSDISVDTERNGNVVLTGTTRSEAGRLRAGTLAAGVKGVRNVRNEIRIIAGSK